MEALKPNTKSHLYFIAKSKNILSLKQCLQTGQWACCPHQSPPSPPQLLTDAFQSGNTVVLIFSVNNCHGWHGYAFMENIPGSISADTKKLLEIDMASQETDGHSEPKGVDLRTEHMSPDWKYFTVHWHKCFMSYFGEKCLSFSTTTDLALSDGSPVNKSRNWQQLPELTGKMICGLIDEHFDELKAKKQNRDEKILEDRPKPFISLAVKSSVSDCWSRLLNKVGVELGHILLACPFGSQRYNLQTAESDVDMFVVYQASTKDLLGFDPPKQTIKNSEAEDYDYTVLEVHRYCELLLAGDPKCVETLFLHESTIVKSTSDWLKLQQLRSYLLNRECLDKYLGDAYGSKGVKKLRKWKDDNPGNEVLPAKVCKLVYIIVRLLYSARSIVHGQELRVFNEDTEERRVLMSVRSHELSWTESWTIINRLQEEIESWKESVPHKEAKIKHDIEEWLLGLRYKNIENIYQSKES